MIYSFDNFELDTAKLELRRNGAAIPVERQVFGLLCFLVENRDRVVTKEEIIGHVWDGRIVSDSAVSSRIKSARQAIGDDGNAQRVLRTIHGVGFRFVAEVAVVSSCDQPPAARAFENEKPSPLVESTRPSIAVIPFRTVGEAGPRSAIADALPQDLITELSRLRWLFVIARASSFRFRSDDLDLDRISRELGVRYCLSGSVEILSSGMIVSVELSDVHDKGIVWSDRFKVDVGAVHEIREEIVRAVINALELQIPLNEARKARWKPPDLLDAWAAYHMGLQHMYRFNKADNAVATGLFERAVALDPGFSRAYAGLSFTHFQDSFLGYTGDVNRAAKLAEQFAAKSLELDPLEPFGNLTMGRSAMLKGDLEGSIAWLDRANTINPNYAQAKYSRAWSESMMGQVAPSQCDVDEALALSPLDPLRYAMLSVRAFSHIVMDQRDKAADWAERGAKSPGAHVLVELIAVAAHGLNGNDRDAKLWTQSVRSRAPGLTRAGFFRAFPFRDEAIRKRVSDTLERYGF